MPEFKIDRLTPSDFHLWDEYVLKHPEDVSAKALGLQASVQSVSDAGLDAWIEAVGSYRSQLAAVFEDLRFPDAIRDYFVTGRGIRLWGPWRAGIPAGPSSEGEDG